MDCNALLYYYNVYKQFEVYTDVKEYQTRNNYYFAFCSQKLIRP